jgi:hypothetical protein
MAPVYDGARRSTSAARKTAALRRHTVQTQLCAARLTINSTCNPPDGCAEHAVAGCACKAQQLAQAGHPRLLQAADPDQAVRVVQRDT